MIFKVKEMFYSLQGEGARAGRAAVFCRFSKCNLWNGREDSRAQAVCQFCAARSNGMVPLLSSSHNSIVEAIPAMGNFITVKEISSVNKPHAFPALLRKERYL